MVLVYSSADIGPALPRLSFFQIFWVAAQNKFLILVALKARINEWRSGHALKPCAGSWTMHPGLE
jgi:hypothetical protein